MRLITIDDIIDTYTKLVQRGPGFIISKFNPRPGARTLTAFDSTAGQSSNAWDIPYVKERWNSLITGDPAMNFEEYLVKKHLGKMKGLKLLSPGSGSCSHELELAGYPNFSEILCIDMSRSRLDAAAETALKEAKTNISFACADMRTYNLPLNYFDIVLFNASLHHFKGIDKLLAGRIKDSLKEGGMLVINEYVGARRLQYPASQINAINDAVGLIDPPYRKRYMTNLVKRRYRGSGIIRMIIADPSECVESDRILPAIHKNFTVIEEKPYGGNLIVSALKDISHHFTDSDKRKREILDSLFKLEDNFLRSNQSDYIFGIYKKG